jgi:hypothetical protein
MYTMHPFKKCLAVHLALTIICKTLIPTSSLIPYRWFSTDNGLTVCGEDRHSITRVENYLSSGYTSRFELSRVLSFDGCRTGTLTHIRFPRKRITIRLGHAQLRCNSFGVQGNVPECQELAGRGGSEIHQNPPLRGVCESTPPLVNTPV